MKRATYILLLTVSFFFCTGTNQPLTVRSVMDGDTVLLNNGQFVRYIGIDAPEINYKNKKADPFGFEAKEKNIKMVSGKSVRMVLGKQKKDHYGRLLAYVYLYNGTFVNREMIKSGLAWVLYKEPNIKFSGELLRFQQTAMSGKRGLWNQWEEEQEGHYIGNSQSKRFHHPVCPYGRMIKPRNRVVLKKKWDAFFEGFSPCKKCCSQAEVQK